VSENHDYKQISKNIDEINKDISELKNSFSKFNYMVYIVLPIATLIIAFFTSYLTSRTNIKIEETKFKQNAIKEIITSSDISDSRNKLLFLIDSKLINDEDSLIRKSIQNLRYVSKGFKLYTEGNEYLDSATNETSVNHKLRLLNKAAIKYSESIENDPYSDISFKNRAFCLFKIALDGDRAEKMYYLNEAIADYSRSIKMNNNNPDAYFLRGLAYHNLLDNIKALEDYEKSLELDSLGIEPHYYKDIILYNSGKSKEAESEIATAINYNTKRTISLLKESIEDYTRDGDVEFVLFLQDLLLKYNQ